MNNFTIIFGLVVAFVATVSAYGVGESYGSRYDSFDGIEDGGHYGGHEGYEAEEGHDGGHDLGGYEVSSHGFDDGHGDGGHHEDHKDYHHHPSYKFEYGVKDPKTKDSHSHWEHRDGDKVHGEYSLDEADGTKRIVRYSSDHKTGFQAHVEKIGHATHEHGGHGGYGGHGHGGDEAHYGGGDGGYDGGEGGHYEEDYHHYWWLRACLMFKLDID